MSEKLAPDTQLTPDLRLVRLLGRGSMGEVWEGQSRSYGRIAVKFLAAGYLDNAAIARFEREREMQTRLRSSGRGFVPVLDWGMCPRGRLAEDGRIELRNFGVFEVKRRAARKARNPKTGEEIPISARRVVTFRPGQKLKARVEEYAGTDPQQ